MNSSPWTQNYRWSVDASWWSIGVNWLRGFTAARAILFLLALSHNSEALADDIRQMLPSQNLNAQPKQFVGGVRGHDFKNSCTISLRVVEGDQRVDESTLQPIKAGEALVDLGDQLQALPFRHFRLLGSKERLIAIGDETVFNVVAADNESHSIHIVPSEMKNGKVGVSINWFGPTGENMLDTKVLIPNGENMVLGADGAGDSSSILCLKVRCN